MACFRVRHVLLLLRRHALTGLAGSLFGLGPGKLLLVGIHHDSVAFGGGRRGDGEGRWLELESCDQGRGGQYQEGRRSGYSSARHRFCRLRCVWVCVGV